MRKIPFSPPDLGQDEIDAVVEVLKSGWITTGPKTKLLEKRIGEYCHTGQAVCLSSQTSCAEMTLRILGVGPQDEVILPAYTYTATASVVYHVGATPVMIDCKPGTFEMDYDKMEAAINEHTKVIIPVDLAGIVCDYDRIYEAVRNKRELFQPNPNSKIQQQKQKDRAIKSDKQPDEFKRDPSDILCAFMLYGFHHPVSGIEKE